jgi:hypothetical protein
MHAAIIDESPRLNKVLEFLRFHGPSTTMEIMLGCQVCAVNSIIAELRANGYTVLCQAIKGKRGVYSYRLVEGDQPALLGGM